VSAPPLLQFENISVRRGDRLALNGFTLRVDCGEHVAILGPNGCGKSTLLKTILRECYPLQLPGSRLSLLGRDTWNIFELRSTLGVVSNDLAAAFARDVTGLEAVLSGFFSTIGIHAHQQITPQMRKKAMEALERVDAAHLANRWMDELSSGEERRVLVARALVHEPRTLLLDEPSTSLDIAAQHELRESLRSLAREGLGLLLVTHHVAEIVPEIERVVLLQDGQVFLDGSKQDILQPGILSELFGIDVELGRRDGYYYIW
jgi:iron complex transport system ATP-binding protein